MAKVRNNPVVQGISGGIGNLVFRQMPDGSTYISGKQDFSKRKFSQGQKDHQSRFQRAVAYARAAARSQPIYAELAAGTILSPYNIALSDWFHPPVIHCVERRAGTIYIQASDDVCVAGVEVRVLDEEGVIKEKEEGVRGEGDWWEYVPTAEGKVVVEARDLAGNVSEGGD
ncbi:MAG: hypothetical protein EHM40_10515 [Chloroflexi bacterium]|nr:MAG: hypothetical protein EHM40_10515 [Chloroflexota bacterium]